MINLCETMKYGTYVFIDGGYLSLISKHFGKGKYFALDLNQFAITLSKSQGLWCEGVFYYTAPPYQSNTPTTNEREKKAKYDKWVSRIRRIKNFNVREGRCQKTNDGFNQKGVDTLLTMDLFDICNNTKINTIIIVICDTDFVPILEKLKEQGVEIILFYFSDYIRKSKFSMSNHLLTVCNRHILLELEHFTKSMKG